jgi:hypothetical protein
MHVRRALLNTSLPILLLLVAAASAQDVGRARVYRINRDALLYESPSADAKILRRIPAGTVVEVTRVLEQWVEVHSTRGNPSGFVRRSYAEPYEGRGRGAGGGRTSAERAFRPGMFRLTDPAIVREEPDMDAPRVATLDAGTQVRVVGRTGNWYRVESATGKPPGYIPVISAVRVSDLDVGAGSDTERERDSDTGSGRDYEAERDRDYDRARDYDPDRDREYDRDRDYDSDRDQDYDRDEDYDPDRGGEHDPGLGSD